MRSLKINNYRPDIDGVRAIAVLSVIGFHAFPSLVPGGFVGVDIFFVISGFLITQIIVSELDAGKFKIRNFYSRRIRRIIPSLLPALAIAVFLGWILLLPQDFKQFGSVLWGSTTFLTNFVLYSQVGYFDVNAVEKPLLHLWSLSIEEQFYIFWPLLLILIYTLRRFALAVTSALLLASFYYEYSIRKVNPELAFYSPLPRFWELLIGGVLAFIYLHHQSLLDLLKKYRVVSEIGSLFSFLLICYALLFSSTDKSLRAVVSGVLGSAGLILFGYAQPIFSRLVGNRVSVWVGLISYPLYLWHWIFLSFAIIYFGNSPSSIVKIMAITLSFVLAYICYRYLELWMRDREFQWRKVGALIAGLVVFSLSGLTIQQAEGFPRRLSNSNNSAQLIRVDANDESCFELVGIKNPAFHYCRYNNVGGSRTIVFTGDSHVHASWKGITDYYGQRGINTLMLANQLCPPIIGAATGWNARQLDECAQGTEQIVKAISTIPSIDTVVFLSRGSYYITGHELIPPRKVKFYRWPGDINHVPSQVEKQNIFQTSLQKTVDLYRSQGKKVFIVSENPELPFTVKSCANFGVPRALSQSYCKPQNKAEVLGRQKLARSAWISISGATYIDTISLFCPTTTCNYLRNGILLYSDDDHLSKLGSTVQVRFISRYIN